MLIMSRVCADFYDRSGAKLFSVTPATRLTFQEAPESIRQDPLFDLLVNDGSLEVSVHPVRRKKLEQDPLPATGEEERPKKSP